MTFRGMTWVAVGLVALLNSPCMCREIRAFFEGNAPIRQGAGGGCCGGGEQEDSRTPQPTGGNSSCCCDVKSTCNLYSEEAQAPSEDWVQLGHLLILPLQSKGTRPNPAPAVADRGPPLVGVGPVELFRLNCAFLL